ncbi:MAG: lipoate--protein ligase [Lachnospiraceae bacterium]|nr:lipoate--protein ligase [Lachnospiraceae bacterium]
MIKELKIYCAKGTNPYRNLAIEEYLTFHTKPGECILFLWQNQNTVVIGKNQNAYKECKVSKLEESGGYLARRLSGGGAVYHDLGNLNFTFCIRKEEYDLDRQLNVILRAVKSFGLNAEKTGRNDIVAEGRKFSGNAFFSSGEYAYNHGTIMIDVNRAKLSDYLTVSAEKLKAKGVDSVKSRVVNLHDLNPEITVESMGDALAKAFDEEYELEATPWMPGTDELEDINIRAKKFASEDWRFNKKLILSNCISRRFPFGEVEILYEVVEGVIDKVKVYTDSMDETLAERVEEILKGLNYRKDRLIQQEIDGNQEIVQIIRWFAHEI